MVFAIFRTVSASHNLWFLTPDQAVPISPSYQVLLMVDTTKKDVTADASQKN